MHARASTLQGDPAGLDEAIQQYRNTLSRLRDIDGNSGALLLVDRSSGKAVAVTLWDSEQAMTDSREQANQMRQQAADEASAQVASVEEYEVAVWDAG